MSPCFLLWHCVLYSSPRYLYLLLFLLIFKPKTHLLCFFFAFFIMAAMSEMDNIRFVPPPFLRSTLAENFLNCFLLYTLFLLLSYIRSGLFCYTTVVLLFSYIIFIRLIIYLLIFVYFLYLEKSIHKFS